jgi:uncharacterized protein (DUF305 family)
MKNATLKSLPILCFAPLAAVCLMSTALAQTSAPMGGMGSNDMKTTMMTSMDAMQKMTMSGDIDKDFAMMMKIHHQQGVEMAKMELMHGKSPEMKQMTKQIVKAQNKEIAEFDRWLAK